MKNIIIDCDPGHDDAVAIFMALAHKDRFNLKAVTTVCGNNTIEKVTKNAHYILSSAKAETLVAKGAIKPSVGEPIISTRFHGESGMDGPTLEVERTSKAATKDAVEVIAETLRASKEKVTLVPLGPLTNIATLLAKYPELICNIEEIVMMGGGIEHGNITKHAEFNIYVDPEAASKVFASNIKITMCGLDVTKQVKITREDYEYLRNKSDVGRVFAELMDFYIKGRTACMMHDPCAVAYLIAPMLFNGKRARIEVVTEGDERGKVIADFTAREANTFVVLEAKGEEVSELILKSIERM